MNADPRFVAQAIIEALPGYRYSFATETQLHDGMAQVLSHADIGFEREYSPDKLNRFDFLCDAGVVVEAKIKGGFGEALQQCARYCALDITKAVVLVGKPRWSAGAMSRYAFNGKTVYLCPVEPQAF